ncbi:MAG: nuclear transport factor 2 family protein [Dehalococcoidia bacterium]
MRADPKTEGAVVNIVKQGFEAFTKRDLDAVLAFFAPDPDVVVIGTGGDEKCVGLAEIRNIFERAFAQFEEASFKFGWHSVSAAGSVALLATDVTLYVKTSDRQISEQVRLTVVLEQRGDRWLIIQWHDSLPAAGQKDGQAFAT